MDKTNREILNLAIPSIVSNITVPLLGLVDLTIVGHIGNENYISAIAIGSMIFNIMYWILGFLRMGTSGMTSQAYGREDWEDALRVLLRALTIGVGMGLAFIVCQSAIEWGMVRAMNTPESSFPLVRAYFRIAIWGAPAMLGLYGLTGWFIGMQNTKIPMLIAIVQNIINIFASLLFVFAFGWKIEGVAAGTLIAQWSGFFMALFFVHRGIRNKTFYASVTTAQLSLSLFKSTLAHVEAWQRFFVVNRDIFLRTLCLVAVNLFFTSAGGKQGALMLSVNTLLMTMFTLFSYFMDGFAYAGEALSGKLYGAKDKARFLQMVRRLFFFGGVMVVLFTSVYVFGGLDFLRLLTDEEYVVRASIPYLVWVYFIPLAGVAAFIYDGIFIGMTETKGMLVPSAIAMACFFAFYYVGKPSLGNNALWIAFLLFLSFRGILQFFWARKYVFNRF
ncbi:GntR family transcriptional regulator [Prevotella intermedia ZT]|uniref:GntR family transcriptional regulator n=1 Tax=Prevotella intermedia ZT TaxID=1347790 RepID=A0AAP0V6Z8_PREIN|nr:MATE family efflux transporter [Prevotella intermedia]KJJ87717.1 GntR family transcriptional regulator [Prevotella intermedia ZT]